ncbi:MAG TPA: hypothetical protein VMK05_09735, partial [Burkholderiales bacterium]|nr:hypothetical protein [Burkholderiales bacterium]
MNATNANKPRMGGSPCGYGRDGIVQLARTRTTRWRQDQRRRRSATLDAAASKKSRRLPVFESL